MIKILIALHILSGSVAVLGMLCALSTRKGGQWHKYGGRAYVYGMAIALVMATCVSIATTNVFLFLIALFSGYLIYTGWRLVKVKDDVKTLIDRL